MGDCKTLKNQSPISRALWLKGLMELTGASKGMVILEKSIENDHKLAAESINVALLSDADLDIYIKCTSDYIEQPKSSLCLEDNWDKLFTISQKYPGIKPAFDFSKSDFWNKKSSNSKLRKVLGLTKEIKSELNPDNELHVAFIVNMISLFAISLNNIVSNIFNQYLLPTTKDQLSEELKVLIWGGFESFNFQDKLRKLISQKGGLPETDLSLPDWDIFLQLIRNCLEKPHSTTIIPLLLKELAFYYLTEDSLKKEMSYLSKLASNDLYTAKFAYLTSTYFCQATRIPQEFNEIISDHLLKLQT